MRKLVYVLMLITFCVNAQLESPYKTFNKGYDYSEDIKQIIKYDQHLDFGDGYFYVSEPSTFKGDFVNITGTYSTHIWTDKPIDVIRLKGQIKALRIVGINLHYRGDKIYGNECGAVRIGGFEKSRYGIKYAYFDFNVFGDRNTMASSKPDYVHYENKDFNFSTTKSFNKTTEFADTYQGSGAHALWVDFANKNTTANSYIIEMNVKGLWQWVNTGFKHTQRKEQGNFSNNITTNLVIDAAKTYAFLEGISSSNIRIIGDENNVLKPGSIEQQYMPLWYADVTGTNIDIGIYEFAGNKKGGEGRHKVFGYLKGKKNTMNGFLSQQAITGMRTGARGEIIPFTNYAIIDSDLLVHPSVVDRFNNQAIYGNKGIFGNWTVKRNTIFKVDDYAVMNFGRSASLNFNGTRFLPITVARDKEPKTVKELVKLLRRIGAIKTP